MQTSYTPLKKQITAEKEAKRPERERKEKREKHRAEQG